MDFEELLTESENTSFRLRFNDKGIGKTDEGNDFININASTLVTGSYKEYTSEAFVSKILIFLMKLTGEESFTFKIEGNVEIPPTTLTGTEIEKFMECFRTEYSWGELFVVAGIHEDLPKDFEGLFASLTKNSFVLYVDLDDSLIASYNKSMIKKSSS